VCDSAAGRETLSPGHTVSDDPAKFLDVGRLASLNLAVTNIGSTGASALFPLLFAFAPRAVKCLSYSQNPKIENRHLKTEIRTLNPEDRNPNSSPSFMSSRLVLSSMTPSPKN